MNYKKIYNEIIERGKNRKLNGYKENHHIIPKCVGGRNHKENIVELTAKEHFICHKLLTEIYPKENKLHYAVRMMANMKNMYGRTYKVGAKEYQRLKENIIVSDETKQKTGNSCRNPSDETRKLIGSYHNGKIVSDETKQKIREKRLGSHHTKESRVKMCMPQKKVECVYCGKTGGAHLMQRYHFDNCKLKTPKTYENNNSQNTSI